MVPPVSMMTSLRTLSGICLDRLDGRWPRLLVSLAKVDVLVLDDLALRPLTTDQAADLLEVIEDRSQRHSTIVTSQLPIADWHDALGEPTLADATLDRLMHNAHCIELRGDSLRRRQQASDAPDTAPADSAASAEPPAPGTEPLGRSTRPDDDRPRPLSPRSPPLRRRPWQTSSTNPTFKKEVSTGEGP
jgi:hypothetical protein